MSQDDPSQSPAADPRPPARRSGSVRTTGVVLAAAAVALLAVNALHSSQAPSQATQLSAYGDVLNGGAPAAKALGVLPGQAPAAGTAPAQRPTRRRPRPAKS